MGTRLSTAVALPVLAVLAGCGNSHSEPGVFNLPAATVFERLSAGNMDDFRFDRQCGILIHFRTELDTNHLVRWVVTSGGTEVASFAARLTPLEGGKTRVTIEIPPAPAGGEIYDGKQTYYRPALMQPLRPAVDELIAARVEQRPIDQERLPPTTDGICATQRDELEVSGTRFRYDGNDGQGMGYADRSAYESNAMFAETGSSAAPGQPTASAQPMSDARPMTSGLGSQ